MGSPCGLFAMPKLPPYMQDANGFCYATTPTLAANRSLTPWWGEVDAAGFAGGVEPRRPWEGSTVVCIASGPSLTKEDCAAVERSRLRAIAANTSWKRAQFADILFAADQAWWQQNIHEKPTPAQWWTCSHAAAKEFDQLHLYVTREPHRNSGARSIDLALDLGAARILLLGFDCSLVDGVHWHGPHERTMNPDDQTLVKWRQDFDQVAERCERASVPVVNCSRKTALTCFPRAPLDGELKSVETTGRVL